MSRITQVHRILEQKHLDAIIILSDYNRRYLSGFTGTSGALIISKDKQYLITDFRYIDQATKQAPNYEIINRKSTIIGEIKEL
ncbi:TPA: aminopeptidase P family N-terminal domain-containing protein, partial [Staphylococcus aureus]